MPATDLSGTRIPEWPSPHTEGPDALQVATSHIPPDSVVRTPSRPGCLRDRRVLDTQPLCAGANPAWFVDAIASGSDGRRAAAAMLAVAAAAWTPPADVVPDALPPHRPCDRPASGVEWH